jgi:DMSO/TMAO reductase YedYZ molybdopterin-dependent catalytic subunit
MKKFLTTTIITATILLSLTAALNQTVTAETTIPSVLTITGLVDNPTDLTLAQLQALPKTIEYATIICVDFPEKIVEEGNWAGVKLSVLFGTADIKSEAVKIAIYASDGFSSDLPVQVAMEDNIILAYEKDGQALSSLRLVVPGRWGYKWVNLVGRIEAVDYDYLGFWESKGYSDTAIVGQDSGGPKVPLATPSVTLTPTTPIPSKTPTPTPSQNVTTGGQTTQSPTSQNPTQTNTFPKEAVYVLAGGLIAAISIATLVLRKKVKK